MSIIESLVCGNTYRQFEDYLMDRYSNEYTNFSEDDIQDKFADILIMGIRQMEKLEDMNCPYYLLWTNDKIPRRDKLDRVGNILWELKNKYTSFPIVPSGKLNEAVRRVISSGDPRYLDDYREFIMSYSEYKHTINTIDMSFLVKLFPEDRIVRMKQ